MWFIAALIGAVLGGAYGQFTGMLLGALTGALAGIAITGQNLAAKLADLERRLDALEEAGSGVAPRPEPQQPAAQAPAAALRQEPHPASEPEAPPAAPVAPPPLPPRPSAPATPSLWERLFAGNAVVKVGVVVLFFGIAFLLKYTYERIHVPIELRLLGVALAALALLAVGWRLRVSRPGYALALQGGGVAILYLVIFAAFRLFHLLPAPLAFGLLVVVAVASAALAIAQDSLTLAAIGVSGGFLAPVLASTGQGNHVVLFSYYAVLNASIVAVAWHKAWRVLNLLGFAFTFVIGVLWGVNAYRAEYFSSTEPFLLLFFAMYVAIPLLFARRRAVELRDYVDGTLVFGVPLVAFGLQTALVRGFQYGAAYSALGLAAIYLCLAIALRRRAGVALRLLVEASIALSLVFGTLAIPLAFDGRLTSAAWALEGAAIAWISVRQGRLLARSFAYFLQFAAGIAFLWDTSFGARTGTPLLNATYLGTAFLAVGAFFCAAYIERNRERLHRAEPIVALVLTAWGALWWFAGGTHEILRYVDWTYRTQVALAFFAVSSVGFSHVAAAARWPSGRYLALALYPAIVVQLALDVVRGAHPFAHLGLAAWPVAFAAHFWLLHRHRKDAPVLVEGLHAAGTWLVAIVGAREAGWWIDTAVQGKRVWPAISWAIVPALVLAALSSRRAQARWPVAGHEASYVVRGGAPIAVFLALWIVYANVTSDGDPYPLPFVPVLNPLDVAIGAASIVLVAWLRAAAAHGLGPWLAGARPALAILFGFGAFLWVNATLLRTLHHWADLPFALQPMLASQLVQASFSILWMLLAMGAMVAATRRALRVLWIAGAALMGVVVAKLFLVDLSGIGTVERIVSFIGAGLLMLLIGYLSPVPPRGEARA
jgi:uncharacterized membrane protein